MLNFKKISFIKFFLLTFSTFGLYLVLWAFDTRRILNRAGGTIPSGYFLFLPFLNLYFWYKYAQAYLLIVKKEQRKGLVFVYFLTPYFLQFTTSYAFNFWCQRLAGGSALFLLCVVMFLYSAFINYFFYQKGFNEFNQ